ncbi:MULTISPECIES: PIG-L deacetylase family protein [spotted fever group]|uniref:GlcNAc-PI de-N-acetylase n=1 Tax=Rickettsia tamurae subsp. buchneri TaxID=1462938 RepID=A0A8E1C0G4_9RICK|nr:MULTISPECIES: PIG-L family deacetylase [spotted fever group]EER22289.1 GlcNAc-PI de-N-acetylase family protein [Rickettsia endosymbiont of Ixodes scapularis]KDO03398.1 GlcNAc-PI de-N-acetylase [Rickettsia tamurae subsp. buchneri]
MKKAKIILLSPHHDDIAFSIGGMISIYCYTKNIKCYLINIFNKTKYCLPTCKTTNVNKQRNAEDNRFAKQFSLNKINLNFPDSSVLRHTAHSEIICTPHDIRRSFLMQKLNKIFKYIKPNKIFCPLGIGGHIDHKMVKEICLEIFRNNYHNLVFYEDLPYAYDYKSQYIKDIIKRTMPLKLHAKYINITSRWYIKEKSIFFYKSQVTKETIAKIQKYAQSLGANKSFFERIWIP